MAYAHRDAAAFRRYVVEILGYDPANIIDLRDATLGRLTDVFGNERSHEGDLHWKLGPTGRSDVVVFYSGHGVPGLSDKGAYLLPAEAGPDNAEISGYPLELLYGNLGKLANARSVRVFMDTCFSGSSHAGMLISRASPVFMQATLPGEAGEKLTVLTAASSDQIASWDEDARHGLFTRHLLDALYGGGDADGDGQVTSSEAKAYLDSEMTGAAWSLRRRQNASLIEGPEAAILARGARRRVPRAAAHRPDDRGRDPARGPLARRDPALADARAPLLRRGGGRGGLDRFALRGGAGPARVDRGPDRCGRAGRRAAGRRLPFPSASS